MKRNGFPRLGSAFVAVALFVCFCGTSLAQPAAGPTPTTETVWQTLVAWLETLWAGSPEDGDELGMAPTPDPYGRAAASGAELGMVPSPDPFGSPSSAAGDQELNEVPWADPHG